jgi:gliding motility-associated-like protein
VGFTPKPKIRIPVKAETKVILGTSAPTSTVFVDIYNSTSVLIDRDTVTADSYGNWVSYMDTILYYADSITARAQLSGKCRSGFSESDLAYAIVEFNIPTSLSGPADTLFYYENGGNAPIEPDILISDPDDSVLVEAVIKIVGNYLMFEDSLVFTSGNNITGSLDQGSGTMTLVGFSSLLNYQNALAGVSYYNKSEDPSEDVRLVMFTVKDTVDWSDTLYVPIKVIKVNDPPVISGDPDPLLYDDGDGTVVIDGTISITDVDNISLTGAKIQIKNNFDPTEDQIFFTDQLVITGSYNAAGAILTLSGTAALAAYATALSSITYTNSDPNPSQLTRRIQFRVFDGLDSGNIFIKLIDMIATNSPPEIVDGGNNPIDTLYVSTDEDTPVDICLNAIDPDGDNVSITEIISSPGNGAINFDSLCFVFTPDPDVSGMDTLMVKVCDNATPQYCDSLIVIIEIIPVNDPPQILIGGLPLDTLAISMTEDDTLDICLDVTDLESNPVEITEIISITGTGVFDLGASNDFCFEFVPASDYYGTEIANLFVCETISGGLCDSLTLIIDISPVNDAPLIVDTLNQPVDTIRVQMYEDTMSLICVNAIDPDGDPVILTKTHSETNHGNYDLVSAADLCYFFSPDLDFTGEEISKITVCDVGSPVLCDSVIIILEILPVNDKPEVVFNGLVADSIFYTTPEDILLNICPDVTDQENDTVNISSVSSITGYGVYDLGVLDDICFDFVPDLNIYGTEYSQLIVCENKLNGLCDTAVLVITITPVNDAPQIVDSMNQPADTLWMLVPENSVLDNCINALDVENDPVSLTSLSSLTNLGTYDPGLDSDLCFSFSPQTNTLGEEQALIAVCDTGSPQMCDSAILVIEIVPVNYPPDISFNGISGDTITLSTDEDEILNFCLDVTDPNDDELVVSDISVISANGTFEQTNTGAFCFQFIPVPDYFGQSAWNLKICDDGFPSLCDSIVILININPVNDLPVGVNDTVSVLRNYVVSGNVLTNDTDPESDSLFINTTPEGPMHGDVVLQPDGGFEYKPVPSFYGNDYFTYTVCDMGIPSQCSSALVYIIVEDIPLTIYQAVSPNGDGMNEYLRIEGIEFFENNGIRIYDRYNNLVFEASNYNNDLNNWHGQSNNGLFKNDLPEDTYFYVINLGDGSPVISGFIVLKRDAK